MKPQLHTRVSNQAMRVFFQQDDDVEILCKASSVALEGRSCHSQLEGLHLNLLSLVRRMRMVHKVKARLPLTAPSHPALSLQALAHPAFPSVTMLAFTPSSPTPPLAAKAPLQNQIPPPASIPTAVFFPPYRHPVPQQRATLLH